MTIERGLVEAPAGENPRGVGVTRRALLKGVGAGALTVLVAGIGVGSYRVYSNGVLDSGDGEPYDPWSHWRDDASPLGMVAAAILAANPHNSQSWMFAVTPTSVDVFADLGRRTGALDPFGREQMIGLGCAVENLVLAAQARGYRATVALLPQQSDPTHAASITLTPATVSPAASYDAIGLRHSNRGPYTTQTVSTESLATLSSQTDGLPGVSVRWFTSASEMAVMSSMLIDAAGAVVGDDQQSRDAFAWFRNDRADIDAYRDGLTLDGQGLAPLMLSLAKLAPASTREAGDAFWLDQTLTVHTRTAAAYGVITVADVTAADQRLTGGRLLQRIHLAATSEGIALQHMNQVTERIDRELALGATATFGPRLHALLATSGESVLSTFRVGYPAREALLSPRRPVSAVTR
jgi:hypothetical protein